MPAEWEPHEATWIAWPHNRSDWPGRFTPIPWVYAEAVRKLSRVEKVRVLVQDQETEQAARRVLRKAHAQMEAVEFYQFPTDRSWTRDYCPIFVKNTKGDIAVTNWLFNGWAKYDDWKRDNEIPSRIAEQFKMRQWEPGLVLEGGSIDVNGQGLLLATEECLLSAEQARNPGVDRDQIERAFEAFLGADRVLWLRNGITGDDTHGHVDDVARFVDPETVVVASEDDKNDPNYEPLRENWRLLRMYGLHVVKLPMPEPLIYQGQRLPASYANFYIANNLVLVPTFNDPSDRLALNTLADVFPDRKVTGIHCTELVLGLGALHCMTQPQPASEVESA